jgi:menaquinone-specific isochorismate synthase
VYAGAGIVEGTNPSFEWDELDLKASQVPSCRIHDKQCAGFKLKSKAKCIQFLGYFQFAKLLRYQEQHIRYQEAENLGTVI